MLLRELPPPLLTWSPSICSDIGDTVLHEPSLLGRLVDHVMLPRTSTVCKPPGTSW